MALFIPISGFLGAGKTTTMLAAGRLLETAGERVSVITNDQGVNLVDSQLARDTKLSGAGEVTGGCFCCRFEDLITVVGRLREQINPTVILAEAVGSCTDLQSTVVAPLRRLHADEVQVAPLTVLIDPARYGSMSRLWSSGLEPDLAYLYRHQIDEADIIAFNKIDLLGDTVRDFHLADVRTRFPHARVLAYSAKTGAGLRELVAAWRADTPDGHRGFAIDYDRYGAAEAELAWTNMTFPLQAPHGFSPSAWIEAFLTAFGAACVGEQITIGHVKVRLTTPDGTAKASLTNAGDPPGFDEDLATRVTTAAATLNARVQLPPERLGELIDTAVRHADTTTDAFSGDREGDIFRPGYPVPVHRM